MRASLGCPVLVLGLAGSLACAEASYVFTTPEYVIQMVVKFPSPYSGRRLSLYDSVSGKEICVAADGSSGTCVERFVGALAVVKYSVRRKKGRVPAGGVIREYVTAVAQSSGLPERPPFEKTQPLVNGRAGDIQLFGYDESALEAREHPQVREEADAEVFRSYRQHLYLNNDSMPFAVIEWKHTLDRITIVHIEASLETTNGIRTSAHGH